MAWREIKPEELVINPFDAIGRQWMLVTAGDGRQCNTMTASWGGLGVIWGKPSATIYIRQTRYTKEFIDEGEYFTLSFFDEQYRGALSLCGTVSGRDRDKIREAGLTVFSAGGAAAFEEARLVLVCRKVYHQYMGPEGFDVRENAEKWYPDKDYHTMYIGSVERVLIQDGLAQ